MTRIWLAVLAAALVTPAVHAQEAVLTAIPGRAGSISAAGDAPAVYLRWDVTEGAFPPDLVAFEVRKDGALVATIPFAAADTVDATQLEALYADPANDRRWRELVAWHQAAAEGDPSYVFSVDEVVARLAADPFWAHFASRLDPTLAAARGLAWVDAGATGAASYRLDGVLAAPERRVLLGFAEVDAASLWRAPAVADLAQLTPDALGRCDAPEVMRAHGVVALTWTAPGGAGPERFGLAQATAGWDLYRSAAPIAGDAPPRDLAAEGAALPHDARGEVAFPGLVKLTEQPLLASADPPERAPGYTAWAPRSARWLETLAEVQAQGRRPGERYAYYLVARDVTGNYGDTAALAVTIPDLLPPPAPWSVRVTRRAALRDAAGISPEALVLRWPQVDLTGYVADHAHRTWCNLADAKATRTLAFTDADTCPAPGAGVPVTVNLDVDHYDIYRFDSAAAAAGFVDSDGDGAADRDERAAFGDPAASPPFTTPGTACDPAAAPDAAPRHKVGTVPASDATAGRDGRLRLAWAHPVPPEEAGRVSWYRVVAVSAGGARSAPSAPVRAFFPARRTTPTRLDDPPEVCRYDLDLSACESGTPVTTDATGNASVARVSCGAHSWSFPVTDGAAAPWAAEQCGQHAESMSLLCQGKRVFVSLFDAGGALLERATLPDFHDDGLRCVCGALTGACVDEPLGPAAGVFGVPSYDPETECLAVYREIGGRQQRVDVVCDALVTDLSGYYGDLLGGTVCLYSAVQGASGALTPKLPFGCEEASEAAAEVPQVAGLTFPGDTTGRLRIVPPSQPVLGFVAELTRDGDGQRISAFVPAGPTDALGAVAEDVTFDAPVPEGATETWCLRARTVVSRDAASVITDSLSDWSSSICALRQGPAAVAPTYLPWPAVPVPPEGPPLAALYLDTDGLPIVHLASAASLCANDAGIGGACVGGDDGLPACLAASVPLGDQGCGGTCAALDAALAGSLGFVAYRQERRDALATSTDLVQVSPLIDLAHCAGDVLDDPWVGLAYFSGTASGASVEPWIGLELFLVDRYPHLPGRQYRYQLVTFDGRGEPVRFRTSDWITATPEVTP